MDSNNSEGKSAIVVVSHLGDDYMSSRMNLIVLSLNSEGIVVHANEKCCTLLGYDKKDIIGKKSE